MMTAWVTKLKICGHLTTNVSTAREAEHASKELEEKGEKALSPPFLVSINYPSPTPTFYLSFSRLPRGSHVFKSEMVSDQINHVPLSK